MRIDRGVVATLLATELRMLLRDRRTVALSIVLPLVIMPLMLFAGSWVNRARERKLAEAPARIVIAGARADAVRDLVERLRALPAADKPPAVEIVTVADATAALAAADLDAILEGLDPAEARRTADPTPTPGPGARRDRDDPDAGVLDGVPVVRIVYRADRDRSEHAAQRLGAAFARLRGAARAELLARAAFPVAPETVAAVTEANLASAGHKAGLGLGRTLTLLLLLFLFSGGSVVAVDALAGEKERGTLETLLTTAAGRLEIVTAKLLAVVAVALTITAIQAANFLVYVGFGLIPTSADLAAAVPPAVAILLFVLYLPVALLVSGVLLLVSGHARTYKEAQLNFFPVMLLGIIPALAPFLPGVPLRSAIVAVPLANLAVAVKEVLTGTFDWPMLALAWAVTAVAGLWVARLVVRTLTTERLITASDLDAADLAGGPALFPKRVVRWFALGWVALFLVSSYAGEGLDLRVQLAINLVVVFLGGSLVLIRWYRLDIREALALRRPRPAVWVAVAVAVPSALLTGIGVFRLANLVVPVPRKMLEAFGEQLLPADIPLWQLVLFLTVLPGICEEIAFRGVLLHGLRRRLRPVPLALVVGITFGLFHFALFRIAPTAFLGVLLAAVTLLTGSIYPAMVWHAANNALGIVTAELGIDLGGMPAGVHVAAAAILALAAWIVWRNRTPYPGLRVRSRHIDGDRAGVGGDPAR